RRLGGARHRPGAGAERRAQRRTGGPGGAGEPGCAVPRHGRRGCRRRAARRGPGPVAGTSPRGAPTAAVRGPAVRLPDPREAFVTVSPTTVVDSPLPAHRGPFRPGDRVQLTDPK